MRIQTRQLIAAQQSGIRYVSRLSLSQITQANCYKSPTDNTVVRKFSVLFPAGFVLHSLASIKTKPVSLETKKKIDELKEFLISEINNYSYNYFTKDYNSTNVNYRLPDDLDDTALIASALFIAGNPIEPKLILKATSVEVAPGGPYRTWFIEKAADTVWRDIDPVVNAHFAYVCALINVEPKNLPGFLAGCLDSKRYDSPYYPSRLFFYSYYAKYLSTAPDSDSRKKLVRVLDAELKSSKLSALEMLLLALSYSHLKVKLADSLLKHILAMQRHDGSVDLGGFCLDYSNLNQPTTTGNSAVFSAIFVEILEHQLRLAKLDGNKTKSKTKNYVETINLAATQEVVEKLEWEEAKDYTHNNFPFGETTKPLSIPALIATSLKSELSSKDIANLSHLTSAAYLGWCGYTTFDKVLDNQTPNKDLAISNYLLRLSQQSLYQNFWEEKKLLQIASESWTHVEKNYYWEMTQGRIADREDHRIHVEYNYQQITQRMSAFVNILAYLPKLLRIKNAKKYEVILKQLLNSLVIIDQLNDDAHDWEEDLENGIVTFVTAMLINSGIDKTKYREYFWTTILPKVVEIAETEFSLSQAMILGTKIENSPLHKTLLTKISPLRQARESVNTVKVVAENYSK